MSCHLYEPFCFRISSEHIKIELGKIASNIPFKDTNAERQPLQITERRTTIHTVATQKSSRKVLGGIENLGTASLKASQSVSKAARRSVPAPVTKPVVRSVARRSVQLNQLETFENDLVSYKMQAYPKEKLFEGVRNGNVCKICCSIDNKNDEDLAKCSACGDYVHSRCVHNSNDTSIVRLPEESNTEQKRRSSIKIRMKVKVTCNECPPSMTCFACKEATATTQLKQCSAKSCDRHYHANCLENWNQSEFTESDFKCPLHVCHTCYSNNVNQTTMTTKFTFCIKCLTAYHYDSWCIPAGTIILNQKQHICIRHRSGPRRTLPSLDWCFRCGKEGESNVNC